MTPPAKDRCKAKTAKGKQCRRKAIEGGLCALHQVKGLGGRPRKKIDWDAVDKLAAIDCTQGEIAAFLGVNLATISRACERKFKISFADFWAEKRLVGNCSLRRLQWGAANAGDKALLIFLGKQRLGQSDKLQTELTGKDGEKLEQVIKIGNLEVKF